MRRRNEEEAKKGLLIASYAEHVFMKAARSIPFTHRTLLSLRHPFTEHLRGRALKRTGGTKAEGTVQVNFLLRELMRVETVVDQWKRVGDIFDAKADVATFDETREAMCVSSAITVAIEALWGAIPKARPETLDEAAYHAFHCGLASWLFRVEDMGLLSVLAPAFHADYMVDAGDGEGVTFPAFALSMLELADNWVASRDIAEMTRLLQDARTHAVPAAAASRAASTSASAVGAPRRATAGLSELSECVYYSGGIMERTTLPNGAYRFDKVIVQS